MSLDKLRRHAWWGPLIIRAVTGIIFFTAGLNKLLGGVGGFADMLENIGLPLAGVLAWVVALSELIGGALLLLGAFTRYAAIVLAMIMVVSTVVVWGGFIGDGGFQAARLDVLLLATTISLAFMGSGKWALRSDS